MIYLTHHRGAGSTLRELIDDHPYPQHIHWFPETYAKVKSGLSYPAHSLADKVLDQELIDYVRDNPTKGKTGFILAAGSQGWAGIRGRKDDRDDGKLHYKLRLPLVTLTNIYAGRVASMFGPVEYVATDASACASSIRVLMDVQNLMTNFGFTRMIVLGVEDAVNNSTLEFFGQAKASLQYKDEQNGAKPSAFDSVYSGFNIGQGAGLAIFETEPVADPKAILRGTYTSAEDFTNPLGQRPDGQGYCRAMEGALTMAQMQAGDIRLIKTHGTGTVTNNTAEKAAITSMFNDFVAVSYKQRVGHTLAASGLMETSLFLNDLKTGVLPGIPNRSEDDEVFISKDTQVESGPFVTLAAGMGNVFSAAIFDPCVSTH